VHLGTPLPFDVATAASLRELSSEPGELVLVDTPPGTATAIDAAIDVADLVIIPTGPRAADIDRVWPTLDITQHRPTTILLTLVDMRKVEAVEIPRGLAETNAPVLRSIVRLDRDRAGVRPGHPAVLGRLRRRVRRADGGGSA
jgi:chromosome partitioning protein